MTVGGGPCDPVRIAARVTGFVKQGGIVDAVGLTIKRRVGGGGDRDRRFNAAPRVDMRYHDPR